MPWAPEAHSRLLGSCEKHAVAVLITTLRALNLGQLFRSVISTVVWVPRLHAWCFDAARIVAGIALSAITHSTRAVDD